MKSKARPSKPYGEKDLAGDIVDYLDKANTYSRGIYEKMHARHIATGNQLIVRVGEDEFLVTCSKRNSR